MKGEGYLLGKRDGGSERRGSPLARNTRPPRRGLGWRSSRLNVRTAAVNGVDGIDHIDTLLRTCAAKGCAVIGLQETKRDGTFEFSASGYRVFFSGDCSMVKGRKGHHVVELAMKEEIVEKTDKDGITIECISARLVKARITRKP